ncbi:hypothetical protein [Helicobacter sp. MIT 14-3879]|uniref:hypothetical protein n=1 Tax=Helicobacter sp. MIT 14-3879 TaxID=2040649 RepID=UPI000E1F5C36|nr:hypothetical protein [Helicobacter sp. MIT 14-3879]RDU65085.1 hypothetical protein CQA44_01885 [Helicobacter sp. MIT 14-3879]
MKKKFDLRDLKNNINEKIKEEAKNNINSVKEKSINLKFGEKIFIIKLTESSKKEDFKKFLSNVVSKTTNRKLTPKTQASYLKLLAEFIKDELEPSNIAKSFDIYKIDSSLETLKALKALYLEINNISSPLYKINKNDYRHFKGGYENKYRDEDIRNYLGGDPSASLKYYIDFLSNIIK